MQKSLSNWVLNSQAKIGFQDLQFFVVVWHLKLKSKTMSFVHHSTCSIFCNIKYASDFDGYKRQRLLACKYIISYVN